MPNNDAARALYESLECDNNHNVRDITRIINALREAEARVFEQVADEGDRQHLEAYHFLDWCRDQAAARRAGKQETR